MLQYKQLVNRIVAEGVEKTDRTGTGTWSVFGHQMRFNLSEGFPLVTGKKTILRSIIHELLWFLKGDTNIEYLNDNDVHIWDQWADENGDLGPVYGSQWRSWPRFLTVNKGLKSEAYVEDSIDQIRNVINMIRTTPDSRRLIVSAWNPVEIEDMALPPCHCLFQFNCTPLGDEYYAEHGYYANYSPIYKLDCQLYQRSCDVFLGVPFNIASYALLTMMIAKICNMVPGDFIWTGGDCHLYTNHLEQVFEYQVAPIFDLPTMKIHGNQKEIEDFKFEDFELLNYQHGNFIKAPIAV